MRRIVGLVGGLGAQSTIDYYQRILAEWERETPGSSPNVVIDSLDVQVGLRLAGSDHVALEAYLYDSIARLVGAGVDFIAMTANTAHLVFDQLAARTPVPIVSIVEVCRAEATRRGCRRLLLLGTRFTMQAPFYPEVFARAGMTVVAPTEEERLWIHGKYVDELLKGAFLDDTRDAFTSLIQRVAAREGVDAVIFGGTELPLLLRSETIAGLPVLDTTALHVAEIVRRLRGRDGE